MFLPLHVLFYHRLNYPRKQDCWLWPENQLNSSGYGQLTIFRKGRRSRLLAHRLSYQIHKGKIPPGLQVMHTCDVKRCVNPHHLKVGTQLENEADKVIRGRSSRGEDRWCATITNKDAQKLLDQFRTGESIPILAARYQVTYWVAYSIAKRTRWKYLV